MTETIINKAYTYNQNPVSTPVHGSSEDSMYPEMTAFDLREWFNWTMLGSFEDPGIARPAITPQMTITSSAAWGASAFILNPVAAAPAAKPKPVFLLIR